MRKISSLFVFFAVFIACASMASATIIGTVSIVNQIPGGVSVWATRTDFQLPANPPGTPSGTGAFIVSCLSAGPCNDMSTNLTWGAGTQLTAGQPGTVKDIDISFAPLLSVPPFATNPGATGLDNFITISGTPIDMRLIAMGPSSTTTDCHGIAVNTNCSPTIIIPAGQPGAGSTFVSPFVLTALIDSQTGKPAVGVQLHVSGTATDGGPNVSSWQGAFTTQISACGSTPSNGCTPGQVQDIINSQGGHIDSSYSASFSASFTAIPEPQTTALVLGGLLILLGKVGMRRLSRNG